MSPRFLLLFILVASLLHLTQCGPSGEFSSDYPSTRPGDRADDGIDAGNDDPIDVGNDDPIDVGNDDPIDVGNDDPIDVGNDDPGDDPVDDGGAVDGPGDDPVDDGGGVDGPGDDPIDDGTGGSDDGMGGGEDASWSFIVYGDSRDDEHRAVLRSMTENTPEAAFVLNVGDVVDSGESSSDWKVWKADIDAELGGISQVDGLPSYMVAAGNHEDLDTSSGRDNWKRYLPEQVKRFGGLGTFFTFDYKNARFIFLESDDEGSSAQLEMLRDALRSNQKPWCFAVWHHPIFPSGDKSYEEEIHKRWGTELYDAGCDMFFTGHAHYYTRTVKIAMNGDKYPKQDSRAGVVQIITGTGGTGLDPVDTDKYSDILAAHASQYSYTELSIQDDRMQLRQIARDGRVLDEASYIANPK